MTRAEANAEGLTIARGRHTCEYCFQAIEPGEAYFCQKQYPGYYDVDELQYFRACRWCDRAHDKLWLLGRESRSGWYDEFPEATFSAYVDDLKTRLGVGGYLNRLDEIEKAHKRLERCKKEGVVAPDSLVDLAASTVELFFDDEVES